MNKVLSPTCELGLGKCNACLSCVAVCSNVAVAVCSFDGKVIEYSFKAEKYLRYIPSIFKAVDVESGADVTFEVEKVSERDQQILALVRPRNECGRVLVYFVDTEICAPVGKGFVEYVVNEVLYGRVKHSWVDYVCRQMHSFSGDMFFSLEKDGEVKLVFGDVEGKGTVAGVLAVHSMGVIATYIQNSADIEDALYASNRGLACMKSPELISANVIRIWRDIDSGVKNASVYCAGSPPPIWVKDDSVVVLNEVSTPLGLEDGFQPSKLNVVGGVLILVTDGVYELEGDSGISSNFSSWVQYINRNKDVIQNRSMPASRLLDLFVKHRNLKLVDDASIALIFLEEFDV